MKKKSPRGIPDFSRQPHPRDGRTPESTQQPGAKPKRGPQPARIVPKASSIKTGQRGQ
jgi:hypothetical protein